MKTFIVKVPHRKAERIQCDYIRIEGGHLIMRTIKPGQYPEAIKVFAPGHWCECSQDGATK